MNIYLLERAEPGGVGYDEYDSCVVLAENEDEARQISPNVEATASDYPGYDGWTADKASLKVTKIGVADEGYVPIHLKWTGPRKPLEPIETRVVCSSFNAG